MSIRTVVVEDEPLARDKILGMLGKEPDIEVVAECEDGVRALAAIEEHRPDLVFLDVQMPELDGFGVIEGLGSDTVPAVIFVTAYDEYAVRAFEVHAMDYLLKPFDRQRLQKALERAREQIERQHEGDLQQRLLRLLEGVKPDQKYLEQLVVRSSGRVFFLRVDEIDWIEAAANYVRLHVRDQVHLLRETMGHLEAKLDPELFLRIHRSSIVNRDRIQELRRLPHGDYEVTLRDGQHLTLSRGYRDKLKELLGKTD